MAKLVNNILVKITIGKKPATQKTCNVEVCTYDYPNGHQHFNDDKDDKDDDDQGNYITTSMVRLVKFKPALAPKYLYDIFTTLKWGVLKANYNLDKTKYLKMSVLILCRFL